MLETEFDDYLGYDNKNKTAKNSRNRYRNKNVELDFGEITLNIPRDWNWDFEPNVIRNYENDISGIENQVIGIYSKKVCLLKIYQGTLKVFMEWIYIIN